MANILNWFKTVLLVMLFYSMAINAITYSMPAEMRNTAEIFNNLGDDYSMMAINDDVQDSLGKTTDIPVVDVGTLVFYSGNVLLDLIVNFLYATPQMVFMLINGITQILAIDTYFIDLAQIFASVVLTVMYLVGLIELVNGLRSGVAIS